MFDVLSAGIVAGGSILGGITGSRSAEKAARAQEIAADHATSEQRRQYDQARYDAAPYRQVGGDAVYRIGHLLGLGEPMVGGIRKPTMEDAQAEHLKRHVAQFGTGYTSQSDNAAKTAQTQAIFDEMMADYNNKVAASGVDPSQVPEDFGSLNKRFTVSDFWNDPVTKLGYQFGLDEGTKALDRMRGASGLRNSGATLKALTRFGQDYAGTKADQSAARFYGDQDRIFNRLAGVSGVGQTATAQTTAAGTNMANNVSNIATGLGNARGAASIAKGNAWNNAFSTIGNWWAGQNMLDKVLNRGGVSGISGMSSTPFAGSFGGMNT